MEENMEASAVSTLVPTSSKQMIAFTCSNMLTLKTKNPAETQLTNIEPYL